MAEMSMNRAIHAAVRRDLDRFTNALSTADGGHERRAEQVSMAWANFHEQLTPAPLKRAPYRLAGAAQGRHQR